MTLQLHYYPGYTTNLTRYCELLKLRDSRGLTPSEVSELQAVNAELSRIEEVSFRSLRGLTNDYDQLRTIGDLGGIEL
jgi:hypothetical protein